MYLRWMFDALLESQLQHLPSDFLSRFVQYDPTIKASEILTALSILIAILGLTTTLWKGMRDRNDAEADKIRGAAARGLSKLERWCRLALWYYEDVRPLFVQTSELLSTEFDVFKARDFLWGALDAARVKSVERILAESIESAYVELSSYLPGAYDIFVRTLISLQELDERRHRDLLLITQDTVTSFGSKRERYFPAELGNRLRENCFDVKSAFESELTIVSAPLKAFLVSIVKGSGSKILAQRNLEVLFSSDVDRRFSSLFRGSSSERSV